MVCACTHVPAIQCQDGGQITKSGKFKFCYKSGNRDFKSAKNWCASQGLQLVQIKTPEKAAAVDDVCSDSCSWLDLTCPSEESACFNNDQEFSYWQWGDGTELSKTHNQMENKGSAIFGGEGTAFCAHFWKDKWMDRKPKWGADPCKVAKYGALCEQTQLQTELATSVSIRAEPEGSMLACMCKAV